MFTGGVQDPQALRFDATTRRFVRDTALDHVVGVNLIVNGGFVVSDPQGRVFLNLGRETAVMQQKPDGTWAVDKQRFARFGATPVERACRRRRRRLDAVLGRPARAVRHVADDGGAAGAGRS